MPAAWKVMVALTVALVVFVVPLQLWGGSLPAGPTLATLVVMAVTVAIGYRIGQTATRRGLDDEEE